MLHNITTLAGLTLVHGTVLAILTWLVCCTLLRKARPAVLGALWTIVLLKFLVPPVLPGEMALSGFLSRATLGAGYETPILSGPPAATIDAFPPPAIVPSNGSGAFPFEWLVAFWGIAVILLGIRFGLHAAADWRRYRGLPAASPEAVSEVHRLCATMGIRRVPRVVATPDGSSPFVVGFVAPTLALPETLLARLQPGARQALILHELAHIRRGDLFVRALQNGARILLFFWPPVWWVCRRIERSAEMACDQWAVAVSRIEPHVYAGSLLEVVKTITLTRRARGQLAFARQGRLLEERFEMILKRNNGVSPKLSWLAIPALGLWASFALAGGGVAQEGKPAAEKQAKKPVRVIVQVPDTKKAELLDLTGEADLDGDGVITKQEIDEFHKIHPDMAGHKIQIRVATEGQNGDGPHLVWEQAAKELLRLHPEADTNQDGTVTEDEVKAFAQAHHGLGDGANKFYFFSADGVSVDGTTTVELTEEPRVMFMTRDGDTEVIEIPPDQEGEWTTKNGDRIYFRRDDSATLEELGATVEWEISEEPAEAYAIASGGEGAAHTVVRLKRIPKEALHEQLTEAEALARGEKLAEARRRNLLRKYPEADLDGDGVISQEEAKALAAKLQSKTRKP